MLPPRCSRPPCMNIAVSGVIHVLGWSSVTAPTAVAEAPGHVEGRVGDLPGDEAVVEEVAQVVPAVGAAERQAALLPEEVDEQVGDDQRDRHDTGTRSVGMLSRSGNTGGGPGGQAAAASGPDAGLVVLDRLVGVVAGAHERPGRDVGEAQRVGRLLERLELVGMPVAHDGQVALAGAQVLADGEDVDARLAQRARTSRPSRRGPRRGRPSGPTSSGPRPRRSAGRCAARGRSARTSSRGARSGRAAARPRRCG